MLKLSTYNIRRTPNNNARKQRPRAIPLSFDSKVNNYLAQGSGKFYYKATQFTPTAPLVISIKQNRTIFHTTGSIITANARPYNRCSSLNSNQNNNTNSKNKSDRTAGMSTTSIFSISSDTNE